jgi:hypothetical protein
VTAVDGPANGVSDVYLGRVPDTEHLSVPAGILVMTLNNGTYQAPPTTPPTRTSDGYLGFNSTISTGGTMFQANPGWPVYIGGVILFGGNGELISRSWGYATWDAANNRTTQIADELGLPGSAGVQFVDARPNPVGPAGPPRTSLGFVLFDQATFKGAGYTASDPQFTGAAYASSAEVGEENWIDSHSTPLLINRFNGTLVRGE